MGKKKGAKKIRLDQLVFDRGLVTSREKAKAMIMAGQVIVGEHTEDKAGSQVPIDANIRLKNKCPYVSRGGLKLEGALDSFSIEVNDFICLDIGASTGGFTDCLLKRGAIKSYTIDVGTNQLDWAIRSDPRVVWRENFHAAKLTRGMIPDHIDLVVIDVSFISLKRILPPLLPFLKEGSKLLSMVKPQFEVGRENVGKGGVVRDQSLQLKAVEGIRSFLADMSVSSLEACKAPIKGPKGNQEYFLYSSYDLKNNDQR